MEQIFHALTQQFINLPKKMSHGSRTGVIQVIPTALIDGKKGKKNNNIVGIRIIEIFTSSKNLIESLRRNLHIK